MVGTQQLELRMPVDVKVTQLCRLHPAISHLGMCVDVAEEVEVLRVFYAW